MLMELVRELRGFAYDMRHRDWAKRVRELEAQVALLKGERGFALEEMKRFRAEVEGPWRVVVQVEDEEPEADVEIPGLGRKRWRPVGTAGGHVYVERGGSTELFLEANAPFRRPVVSVVQGPGLLGWVVIDGEMHIERSLHGESQGLVTCRCHGPWLPGHRMTVRVIGTMPPRGS